MIIEIIIVIGSAVGLTGFFLENLIMFYAGGIISFLGFIRYITLSVRQKDRISISQIRLSGAYQRNKWSPVYTANNEVELQNLIKQFKFSNFTSRAIVYLLACGLLYWFFLWNAFMWIGIVFGFGYLLEFKKCFRVNKK